MRPIEKFYEQLDQSTWDANDIHKIEKFLNDLYQSIPEEKKKENGIDFKRENEAFAFNKSPEKRLSFKLAGNNKLQDGSEIPFEWPDLRTFTEADFVYIRNRFQSARNIFAITEYGLVLYYANQLVRNDDVLLLLQNLFALAKSYIEKAKPDNNANPYILYFQTVLANALHIAANRKADEKIGSLYRELVEFTFEVHQTWDIKQRSGLRTAIDLTEFAIQYLSDFQKYTDIKLFDRKNWATAEYLSTVYIWGAIYVSDISIRLCKKIDLDVKRWLYFKAAQYEKLSAESEANNNLAAVSFVEKAMNIYKGLKDEVNLGRIEQRYQELRTEFKMSTISRQMPEDETQRIAALIKKEISEGTEEEIVKTLMLTPMIRPIQEIKRWSEELFKETMFMNILPASVKDKFGNTIAQYSGEEERRKFALLRTYEFHLQIAVQTLMQYFIEALRTNKISSESVINLLKQTWLGKESNRKSRGQDIHISYIKLMESGISSMFQELNKWQTTSEYLPNFVSATDSLVLKAEYLVREFCYRLDIPTFKANPKQQGIIMEKTLDDLLKDLETVLTENDHFFVKFILTEKAGYNLRNKVAHGLMDNVDYGLEYPVLALIIILKLSNYQFTSKQNRNQ